MVYSRTAQDAIWRGYRSWIRKNSERTEFLRIQLRIVVCPLPWLALAGLLPPFSSCSLRIYSAIESRRLSLENTLEQLEAEMSLKHVCMSICGVALFSTFVNAHSGHGDPSNSSGILHYLTSPIHVLPVLLAAVLVAAIAVSAIRNRRLSAVKVRR